MVIKKAISYLQETETLTTGFTLQYTACGHNNITVVYTCKEYMLSLKKEDLKGSLLNI